MFQIKGQEQHLPIDKQNEGIKGSSLAGKDGRHKRVATICNDGYEKDLQIYLEYVYVFFLYQKLSKMVS